jgi:hypothetical protein
MIVTIPPFAILRPISGGAADQPLVLCNPEGYKGQGVRTHARVSGEPLSAERVGDPGAGAIGG